MPAGLRLQGQLDVDALQRALDRIVARHESLRTSFGMQGDDPVQVIASSAQLALPLLDLQALSPEDQARETRVLEHQASRQQKGERVCYSLSGDVGCGAMDGLKNCRIRADIGARGHAQAADEPRDLIG